MIGPLAGQPGDPQPNIERIELVVSMADGSRSIMVWRPEPGSSLDLQLETHHDRQLDELSVPWPTFTRRETWWHEIAVRAAGTWQVEHLVRSPFPVAPGRAG